MNKPTCCIHECEKPLYGKFLCTMHYNRLYRHGTTIKPEVKKPKCKWPTCDKIASKRRWCGTHYVRIEKPRINDPCSIHGCGKPMAAKFLCHEHYSKLINHGTTHPRKNTQPVCRMPGCEKPSRKLRWCSMHHSRIKRTGSPFDHAQAWTLGERVDCIVCGEPTLEGSGFRRYCGHACASEKWYGRTITTKPCVACGAEIDLTVRHESGRRKYSSASRCKACSGGIKLKRFVQLLIERDGTSCGICGSPVDMALTYPDRMSSSVDHVLPRSLGGPDEMSNYALAHLYCNVKKNNRVAVEA